MMKQIFGKRPTTKMDVVIAFGAAIFAAAGAVDRLKQYKSEQETTEENKA